MSSSKNLGSDKLYILSKRDKVEDCKWEEFKDSDFKPSPAYIDDMKCKSYRNSIEYFIKNICNITSGYIVGIHYNNYLDVQLGISETYEKNIDGSIKWDKFTACRGIKEELGYTIDHAKIELIRRIDSYEKDISVCHLNLDKPCNSISFEPISEVSSVSEISSVSEVRPVRKSKYERIKKSLLFIHGSLEDLQTSIPSFTRSNETAIDSLILIPVSRIKELYQNIYSYNKQY